MEIELVNQKSDNDCVLACVAMVAGVSYGEAEKALKGYEAPYTQQATVHALIRLNCWLDLSNRDMFHGSTYLVTVPSKNLQGVNHCIVVNIDNNGTRKTYDPQKGREGREHYQILGNSYSECERVVRFSK